MVLPPYMLGTPAYTFPAGFELDPGDTLYIPAQYWHWVHSDGFGMAVNIWTEEPHRHTAVPRLYKAESSGWPSIANWDPDRLMDLW